MLSLPVPGGTHGYHASANFRPIGEVPMRAAAP